MAIVWGGLLGGDAAAGGGGVFDGGFEQWFEDTFYAEEVIS